MTEANHPDAGDDANLKTRQYDENARLTGGDWPRFGFTMGGIARLNSLQTMLYQVYIFIIFIIQSRSFTRILPAILWNVVCGVVGCPYLYVQYLLLMNKLIVK